MVQHAGPLLTAAPGSHRVVKSTLLENTRLADGRLAFVTTMPSSTLLIKMPTKCSVVASMLALVLPGTCSTVWQG